MNEKNSSIIWNKYKSIWQELYQEYIYAFKDYQEYTLFVKKFPLGNGIMLLFFISNISCPNA